MTQPGIDPRSPRPLANTLPTRPMSRKRISYLSQRYKSVSEHNSVTGVWTPEDVVVQHISHYTRETTPTNLKGVELYSLLHKRGILIFLANPHVHKRVSTLKMTLYQNMFIVKRQSKSLLTWESLFSKFNIVVSWAWHKLTSDSEKYSFVAITSSSTLTQREITC